MENSEEKEATLKYYTKIKPQFKDDFETTTHWDASYAVLSDSGDINLRKHY